MDNFPRSVALKIGVLVFAFGVVATLAENNVGRPSSTSGLGFAFAPILGVIAGAATFLLALLVRAGFRRWGVAATPPPWLNRVTWLVVLASIPVMYVSARARVLAHEAMMQPRVLVSSALIAPMDQPPADLEAPVEARKYWEIYDTTYAHPVDWNGRAVRIDGADDKVVVTAVDGTRITSTDLRSFDYIREIRAAPFCRQSDGTSLLAVLANLRATGGRAMLLVYAADGRLVYEEHLQRSGGPDAAMLVGESGDAETLVVHLGRRVTAWTCAS